MAKKPNPQDQTRGQAKRSNTARKSEIAGLKARVRLLETRVRLLELRPRGPQAVK